MTGDNKGDDHQLGGAEGQSNDSLDQVRARLNRVEHDLGKQTRPWFRTPSNLISLLAVAVSTGMLFYEVKETQFQKLQQIGQVIDQISALTIEEVELHRTNVNPLTRAAASVAIANRRTALINQADRLLADVDEHSVSRLDLALLAAAYVGAGRYDEAEGYFVDLANAETEPLAVRVAAWRSLIFLYGFMGAERVDDAREAAKEGLDLIARDNGDVALKIHSVLIPHVLASTLMMGRSYEEAFSQLLKAERNATEMLCMPSRQELLMMLRSEFEKILPLYPAGEMELANSRASYGPPCPNDQLAVTVVPAVPQNNEGAPASDYVGDYKFENGVVLVVKSAEGILRAAAGDEPFRPLIALGNGIYAIQTYSGYYLAFQRESTGVVSHVLSLQPNGSFAASRN